MHHKAAVLPGPRPALVAALSLLLLCTVGAEARADVDETERWVPSFAFYFDAFTQRVNGSVASGTILGPPLPQGCDGGGGSLCGGTDPRIRPGDRSSDTDVAPMVGGSLELMTPRLTPLFARPRLFAHGDVQAAFGFDRNLAAEATSGDFALSREFTRGVIPEVIVLGQGSRTKAAVKRWVVSAGVGVAFSFDAFGRRLRLKPSAEYIRQELELQGEVRRAVKLRNDSRAFPDDFRLILLEEDTRKIVHGIGPGIELEVDTLRTGPFLLSVFAAGKSYYLLGDLDDTVVATNEFGEMATFTFDRDRWTWRGGVGIRFRLIPE